MKYCEHIKDEEKTEGIFVNHDKWFITFFYKGSHKKLTYK